MELFVVTVVLLFVLVAAVKSGNKRLVTIEPISGETEQNGGGSLRRSFDETDGASGILFYVLDEQEKTLEAVLNAITPLLDQVDSRSGNRESLDVLMDEFNIILEGNAENRKIMHKTVGGAAADVCLLEGFSAMLARYISGMAAALNQYKTVTELAADCNLKLSAEQRAVEKSQFALKAILTCVTLLQKTGMIDKHLSLDSVKESTLRLLIDFTASDGDMTERGVSYFNQVFSCDVSGLHSLSEHGIRGEAATERMLSIIEEFAQHNRELYLFVNHCLDTLVIHAIGADGVVGECALTRFNAFNLRLEDRLGVSGTSAEQAMAV